MDLPLPIHLEIFFKQSYLNLLGISYSKRIIIKNSSAKLRESVAKKMIDLKN